MTLAEPEPVDIGHKPVPDPHVRKVKPTVEQMGRLFSEAGVEFVDGTVVEQESSFTSARTGGQLSRLLIQADPEEQDVRVLGDGIAYRRFPGRPERYHKPDVAVVRCRDEGEITLGPLLPGFRCKAKDLFPKDE